MIGGLSNAITMWFTDRPPPLLENNVTENIKLTGRIIKISKSGWGFISSRDIEFTRIFFHWTSLQQDTLGFKELKTGMMVEFSPLKVEGKGIRAIHVRVIPRDTEKKESDESSSQMSPLSEQRPDNDR
jgi:cold shock CspA family protein